MGREARKELDRPSIPLAVGDSEHKPVLLAVKLHISCSSHHLIQRHRLPAQLQTALLAESLIRPHNRSHNFSPEHVADCIEADTILMIRQMRTGHVAEGANQKLDALRFVNHCRILDAAVTRERLL